MKFSISRKINLGKYGCDYESLDITVEDATSWEEAEATIQEEHRKIHKLFIPHLQKRYDKLIKKQKLTFKEEGELETLKDALNLPPF